MRELKKPPRGSAPVSRSQLPLESDCSEIPCTESPPPRSLEERRISRGFGRPFTMYRDPARVPLNSSSTGFRSAWARVPVFERFEHRIRPCQQRSKWATVTGLMPVRGWICPVVPLACAGPSECKLVGDDSFHTTLCRSPKSFCCEDKAAQLHLGGVDRIVGEYIRSRKPSAVSSRTRRPPDPS